MRVIMLSDMVKEFRHRAQNDTPYWATIVSYITVDDIVRRCRNPIMPYHKPITVWNYPHAPFLSWSGYKEYIRRSWSRELDRELLIHAMYKHLQDRPEGTAKRWNRTYKNAEGII